MVKRIALVAAALAIGAAAPVSSALAYENRIPVERHAPAVPYEAHGHHAFEANVSCVPSSASEGNANQQNFPVKQYGQTSGGSAC